MTKIPAWRRYLTFWRTNIAADVDDELRFHTEMRIKDHVARGMTEAEAQRAVTARLGDVDSAKAECVELGHVRATHARQANVIDGLRADVRYAVRSLGRAPAWTAVALLTIALGVGATTTVFSVADALLVRPFSYPNASRVFLARRQFVIGPNTVPVSLPFGISRVWRERATTIEDAALAGSGGQGRLILGSDTATVILGHIDPEFVVFAGSRPIVGHVPRSNEVTEEAGMLLLTEQFWRRQYGASPDVVGKTVRLMDNSSTIAGVLPASFMLPDFRSARADVFQLVPSGAPATGAVLVRLKPGVSPKVATAELEALMKNAQLPDVRPVPMEMPLRLSRPQDWLAIRQPLVMLTGAVGLLLLVACTNVAHLLLARGAGRQRELAVRHALGAARMRLVRQLVTETVVLTLVGGVLAIVVGWIGLRVLGSLRPPSFVALTYVSNGRGVINIAAVLAILSGFAIGLLAAVRTAHRDLGTTLRVGAASTARTGRRLRSSLVVGEVALSGMLLVGALLLIHTLFDLQHTELGFEANGVYALRFPVPRGTTPAAHTAFVRERASVIPDVSGFTVAADAPGTEGWTMIANYETPDHPQKAEAATRGAREYRVEPDYFSFMRMPLIAGRTFDEGSAVRNEVIVSRSLAQTISPDGNIVGRRIRNAVVRSRGSDEPWQTVIGVVPDVVTSLVEGTSSAGFNAHDHGHSHDLYRALAPADTIGPGAVTLIVRLDRGDAAKRLAQVAAGIQTRGPKIDVVNLRERIERSLAEPRFTMRVLVVFALLGVLLAAIGLFGVISYSVSQRTREIGVRMTLGATRRSIARLVVGDGVRLASIGTMLGLIGAASATRIIQHSLYGVSRFDPFSFGVGALLLIVVSIVACVVPTLRATAIDPAIAVRAE
jgi:predicted permease